MTGDWEDLGSERQKAVLEIAMQALRETEPTPIPDGNSYSIWIIYEAASFVRVLERQASAFVLDDGMVRKWLPGVLVLHDELRDTIILRCHAIAPNATEEVVLEELRRRLRSDPSGAYLIEELPDPLWSAAFAAAVAELARNTGYASVGRKMLLRSLSVHAPELARPILAEWLNSSAAADRTTAIDILLPLEPELAWPAMKKEVQARGKEAFYEVRCLRGRSGDAVAMNFPTWRSELLEDLCRMLMEVFPFSEDPKKRETDVSYNLSTEDDYRDLRNGLPHVLLTRGSEEDNRALDRLAGQFPPLKSWLQDDAPSRRQVHCWLNSIRTVLRTRLERCRGKRSHAPSRVAFIGWFVHQPTCKLFLLRSSKTCD